MTGAELRAAREALGLTVERFALRAGVTDRTVHHFEQGVTKPRPVTLVALRKALRQLGQGNAP
ncbi:helix-turn-helix domain-containing protein [Phenylobacterium sp. J426]|uniref:helix-turn-helix domain-containing protein n=1 Tax=Phenylobacterium sp. J426 TaxID=2898439 RepID=UPI002151A6E8|nr:helix-turn-helix transcriptional regulator [Phenylobacterium sp. J426]MCR5875078.1 helix-turn-helix domain-containing protein [Phenylobacterium sp. J426]